MSTSSSSRFSRSRIDELAVSPSAGNRGWESGHLLSQKYYFFASSGVNFGGERECEI